MNAMIDNIVRTNPLMDAMLSGPAGLDRLEIVGEDSTRQSIRDATRKMMANIDFFEPVTDVETGFVSKMIRGQPESQEACSVNPSFEIKDWKSARPIMQVLP